MGAFWYSNSGEQYLEQQMVHVIHVEDRATAKHTLRAHWRGNEASYLMLPTIDRLREWYPRIQTKAQWIRDQPMGCSCC